MIGNTVYRIAGMPGHFSAGFTLDTYIEYVPYDKQVEFYKSSVVPYKELVSQLKLAGYNLQKGIVALSSGN